MPSSLGSDGLLIQSSDSSEEPRRLPARSLRLVSYENPIDSGSVERLTVIGKRAYRDRNQRGSISVSVTRAQCNVACSTDATRGEFYIGQQPETPRRQAAGLSLVRSKINYAL